MLQVNTEVFCPSARKKEQGKSRGCCRSELREMRAAALWGTRGEDGELKAPVRGNLLRTGDRGMAGHSDRLGTALRGSCGHISGTRAGFVERLWGGAGPV